MKWCVQWVSLRSWWQPDHLHYILRLAVPLYISLNSLSCSLPSCFSSSASLWASISNCRKSVLFCKTNYFYTNAQIPVHKYQWQIYVTPITGYVTQFEACSTCPHFFLASIVCCATLLKNSWASFGKKLNSMASKRGKRKGNNPV